MADGIGRIDLHIHTTVSDGTDTPQGILELVRKSGFALFSVTDHDEVKAGRIIFSVRRDDDPRFIPGVEFSCKDEKGKYHILGYGFDPDAPGLQSTVKHGHDIRMKKVRARLDFLKSEFGFSFPESEIESLLLLDNPGKPHIGNLMVKYGYAESKEKAIKDYINLVHFKDEYIRPEEVISGIVSGGGIPVLAHPFFGSGDELILGEEMEERLKRMMEYGVLGIEAFYSGFSEKLTSQALALAEKNGLYVTAGSDYHGKNKLVQLGDTGLGSSADYPEGLRRFLRLFEK